MPRATTVSPLLGPSYRLHGVPCVVCGRPASSLALTQELRIIHHVDVIYPCRVWIWPLEGERVPNLENRPALGTQSET